MQVALGGIQTMRFGGDFSDGRAAVADRLEIVRNRTAVRHLVSYSAIGAYLILAAIVVVWLMWAGQYGMAIGVLSVIGGLAVATSGF